MVFAFSRKIQSRKSNYFREINRDNIWCSDDDDVDFTKKKNILLIEFMIMHNVEITGILSQYIFEKISWK